MDFNGIEQEIEKAILEDPRLYEKYFTNCTIQDFKTNDMVKCTYFKGFFKVFKVLDGRIYLDHVAPYDFTEMYNVSPSFLKKVDVDEKWLKVLYGD